MIIHLPGLRARGLQKGQTTLLIVLMVMAVALGIGVAVSQRSTTNLRGGTFTNQTDQAFSCANSGVEDALLCVKTEETAGNPLPGACATATETLYDDGTNVASATNNPVCGYKYDVAELRADSTIVSGKSVLSFKKLPKDSVQQFITTGMDQIQIYWANFHDITNPAAIEITHAYYDGTEYKMEKWAYTCPSAIADVTGFELKGLVDTDIDADTNDDSCDTGLINIISSAESIVRVRSYIDDISFSILSPSSGGFDSIVQGYQIDSQGTAGTVQRNIQVYRMNPQLPPIFDYVLYSEEGSITK